MEKSPASGPENNETRLKEIAGRARQDALQYLEERTRYNLFEKKEEEEEGITNFKGRILTKDSFPVIEKTLVDLKIAAGSYEQKYYLEQFAITTGLNIPQTN